MSCATVVNHVYGHENNFHVVQLEAAPPIPPRPLRYRSQDAEDVAHLQIRIARSTDKKPSVRSAYWAKERLCTRVLTARRSLFQDAQSIADSQPKMHSAHAKTQLAFCVVTLAVHRQNLKRQVCQIFMQAGYERNRREASGTGKPTARWETNAETRRRNTRTGTLTGTLRDIMEARTWMARAQERLNAAKQHKAVLLASQAERLQGKLDTAERLLEGFTQESHRVEDQLAMAHALEAVACRNDEDAVQLLQKIRERRQRQQEMDHEEQNKRKRKKNDAEKRDAVEAAAVRNMAEEEQKHAQEEEETLSREEEADLLIMLAEKEQDRAVEAFKAAQERKEELRNQLLPVRQGMMSEDSLKMCWQDTINSNGSDATIKNWPDNLVGDRLVEGSSGGPSTGPSSNDETSTAVGHGGSHAAVAGNAVAAATSSATGTGGILDFTRATVVESALPAAATAGLAGTSHANAGMPTVGTGDLVTAAAAGSGPNSTNSCGPAIVSTAQAYADHASSQNSTAPTSTSALVSSGSINLEAEDDGQAITGAPAAVETHEATGTTAAVGTPGTIDCTETLADNSRAGKVAQLTLVDRFAQEISANAESSTADLGIATDNTSSHTLPTTADGAADGNTPICSPPSSANGIATDSTSRCISPTTADGMSSRACNSTKDGASICGACIPLQQRPQQTWHRKQESAEEEASTDSDLHSKTLESDSASGDVARCSPVHGRNFSVDVATKSDSSTTGRISSPNDHEGSGMFEAPELKDIRKKAQQSLMIGVDNGSLETLLAKAAALAASDDGHLGSPVQVPAAPSKAGSSHKRSLEWQHHRLIQATGVAPLEQPECVSPAATDGGHETVSKPSDLNEANAGNLDLSGPLSTATDAGHRTVSKPSDLNEASAENLDLSGPLSTTAVALPTTVGAEGSRVLSKLSHPGVDFLSETAGGDWPVRTGSRNWVIDIPGVLELRSSSEGSLPESRCDSQTARPSSIPEGQSQQQISNTGMGTMEARILADAMKAEDLTHHTLSKPSTAKVTEESFASSPALGQGDIENAVAALMPLQTLSKPSSAKAVREAHSSEGSLSSSPAFLQDVLISVRRLGRKTRCDSNVAAAAREALATSREALAARSAIADHATLVPSTQCRGSKSSNYLSPEGLDQMPFVPPCKHASAADLAGVQDKLRQRRSSNSMVMRDAQAEHGAMTGFLPVECLAVTHGIDTPKSPKSPRPPKSPKSSKAAIGGFNMPLNVAGRHVVQPEACRSTSKTASGARATPRGQLNLLPHLGGFVITGSSHDVGAHAERRTRSKVNHASGAQASSALMPC